MQQPNRPWTDIRIARLAGWLTSAQTRTLDRPPLCSLCKRETVERTDVPKDGRGEDVSEYVLAFKQRTRGIMQNITLVAHSELRCKIEILKQRFHYKSRALISQDIRLRADITHN